MKFGLRLGPWRKDYERFLLSFIEQMSVTGQCAGLGNIRAGYFFSLTSWVLHRGRLLTKRCVYVQGVQKLSSRLRHIDVILAKIFST